MFEKKRKKNEFFLIDKKTFQVVEAYLFPTVDENREKFAWGIPEVESIREYAKKTFGWTKKRTDEIVLPVMKRISEKMSQKSIQNYFKITDVTSRKDLKVSKRVRMALEQMAENPESGDDEEIAVDDAVNKKKTKTTSTKENKKTKRSATDANANANSDTEENKKSKKTASADVDAVNDEKSEENVAVNTVIDKKPKKKATTEPREPSRLQKFRNEAIKSISKPKPKLKPETSRKRKVEIKNTSTEEADDFASIPSTSAGPKKISLPDNNQPIPQREKDKEIMESNRLKAIEILKKSKK